MSFPELTSRADVLRMLDELTRSRQAILRRCERLTPEQLGDPVIPGTWSIYQILAHLARTEEAVRAWIEVRPGVLGPAERPAEVRPELTALRISLDEAHAAILAFLKGNTEEVLTERCQFSNYRSQTVGGLLFHLIAHEIHHRAFLLFKLERLEKPTPPPR